MEAVADLVVAVEAVADLVVEAVAVAVDAVGVVVGAEDEEEGEEEVEEEAGTIIKGTTQRVVTQTILRQSYGPVRLGRQQEIASTTTTATLPMSSRCTP